MSYQQLIIYTNKDEVDLISEVCYGLNALSIDFSDSADTPILEPAVGKTPLWNAITLKILFNKKINKDYINRTLAEVCNTAGEFKFIQDKNWQQECNKLFTPLKFGKSLWICPSWADKNQLDGTIIEMDPGMAFGTGTHQTTKLCLAYLDNNPPLNKNVIDFGTGTGILAIASKKLGASKVYAVDNDPQAIIATNNNIKKNNTKIDVILSIEFTQKQVDIVIANILTNTLLSLCDYLSSMVKKNGKIILSGILAEQKNQIMECYGKYFKNFKTK